MDTEQVIIIGGGPAGAATALTLASRGIKTLILEAAACVQTKVGETLPPNVTPLLRTLGLDSYLKEPDHLSCYGNQYIWGGEAVQEKLFIYHTHGNGWHLDRQKFERQLYQLTQDQGVNWRFNCRLLGVEQDIHNHWQLTVDGSGKRDTLKSCFLVDATGRTSKLARCLGIEREHYDRLVGLACPYQIHPEHSLPHYTYIEAVENGWWYAALLPGNRLMTVFMTDADLLAKPMLDIGSYWNALKRTRLIGPLVPDDLRPDPNHRNIARPASSSHLRRIFGESWLAVGDAAFAYDPISSYGLASALGGGFYAGNAIADHLTGKREALPAYSLINEKAYALYLEMLSHQYRLEQHWLDSAFWKRRHREAA